MTILPRSYLYVPGVAVDKLARALDRGADAIIADLEDGVAPSRHSTARAAVGAWLAALPPARDRCIEVWVRVRSISAGGLQDIEAVVGPALTGICAAKAQRHEVDLLAEELLRLEFARGLDEDSVAILPVIETASALTELDAITRCPRVTRLQLGEIDLAADVGLIPGDDEIELLAARSAVVIASAVAGIDPPIAAVNADFKDLQRFVTTTQRQRRLGFHGRACIHPAQVALANETFTPSDDEMARARAVLEAFDAALRDGAGIATGPDGQMIDEAVVRSARTILSCGRQRAHR